VNRQSLALLAGFETLLKYKLRAEHADHYRDAGR